MAVVTRWRPWAIRATATPLIAALMPSVPPEVNTTSDGVAPRLRATESRASSTALRAARPGSCMLDGLPATSDQNGAIAATTSGWTGVVAAWSR